MLLTELNHKPGWEIATIIEDIEVLKSEFELHNFSRQEELQIMQPMSLKSGQFCQSLLIICLYITSL